MKITDLEVLRMDAPTEGDNNWLFVRIHTDEGISGIGEGSLQYKDKALTAELENFGTYLRGKDPFQRAYLDFPAPVCHLDEWCRHDLRYQRYRSGAVGYQGQGPGRARV